ncbi:MAG: DUF998 domain-containing protein [Candidatus Thorarchaeota archaeon]
MKNRFLKYPLSTISGALVILIYCSFTLISWAFYPDPYGPTTHYLSRLGNFNYSLFGAYFYNWGCILTGVALVPFFIGLKEWYNEGKSAAKYVLMIGQLIGLVSAVALIMIGVYSEDIGAPHMQASSLFFELNFFTLVLISLSLLIHPYFSKPAAIYGIVVTLLSLVFAIYIGGPLVEWFTVFSALFFVGLVSYFTLKFQQKIQGFNVDVLRS